MSVKIRRNYSNNTNKINKEETPKASNYKPEPPVQNEPISPIEELLSNEKASTNKKIEEDEENISPSIEIFEKEAPEKITKKSKTIK
jgi:hypothetical protein